MSAASEKSSRTRFSNGAPRPMYNDDAFNSDLDSPVEEQTGAMMRVGKDYQVKIPDCSPETYVGKHEALLVWQPCPAKISQTNVNEFCRMAKEQHKYSEEQALGMLFWHKHDMDRALTDLANFAPFPEEWSTEDKVLFEQAFSYHGKSFHRIREMIPDKTIAALVKYYYSWKKSKNKTSVIDKNTKHHPVSDVISDLSSESESDLDKKQGDACENCNTANYTVKITTQGRLCNTCFQYWQQTGNMRVFSQSKNTSSASGDKDTTLMPQRFNPTKNRKRPPKGIYMDEAALKEMAAVGEHQSQIIIENIKQDLSLLKSQVQTNKQHISLLKGDVLDVIDEYKPVENVDLKPNNKWTQDELLIAVQGVRHYGKDFQAIAEIVGTKTSTQVKTFYTSYKRKYNLDDALAEYEAERKAKRSKTSAETNEIIVIDRSTPPLKTGSAPSSPSSVRNRLASAQRGRASPKPRSNGASNNAAAKA